MNKEDRILLINNLNKLDQRYVDVFIAMYSKCKYDNLNDIVNKMTDDQLEMALIQVKNTLNLCEHPLGNKEIKSKDELQLR